MRFRRTTYLMVLFGSLLVGLGVSAMSLAGIHSVWLLIAAIFLLLSLRSKGFALLLSVGFLGLILGWLRGDVYLRRMAPYQELDGQKVVIQLRAESDAVYDKRRQLSFDGQHIEVLEPIEQELPGRIKVSGFGAPAVNRGDIVRAEGKLFRSRGSRQASISFAELRVLDETGSRLEQMRREFVAGTANALPEPHASFGMGLLIGQRTNLPEHVSEQLSIVGLTHIIAVSGYNLTIIIGIVRRIMAGKSKYQTVLFATGLTGLFLFFTGFSASIVRASIVSGLGLLAWYFGRRFRPVLLLLLTAAVTAMWYPPYLWSDIGWHLSFLAFYGVLVLAPLIAKRFMRHQPKLIGGVVLESLCAQIMTMPLIMYIFGEASVIALVSNAIIVPLVPLAMLLSLFAGIGGMLFPIIAGWFGLPARVLLTYILDMAQWLAGVPHARVDVRLTTTGLVWLYAVLILFSTLLWHRTKDRHDTITDIEAAY